MQFILIMYAPFFFLNSSQIRPTFTPPQLNVLVFIAHHLQMCCPGTLVWVWGHPLPHGPLTRNHIRKLRSHRLLAALQLGWGLVNSFLLHVEIRMGCILCRSHRDSHSCSELVRAAVLSRPENAVSLQTSLTSGLTVFPPLLLTQSEGMAQVPDL